MNRPPFATDIGESRAYCARIASVQPRSNGLRTGAQQLFNCALGPRERRESARLFFRALPAKPLDPRRESLRAARYK